MSSYVYMLEGSVNVLHCWVGHRMVLIAMALLEFGSIKDGILLDMQSCSITSHYPKSHQTIIHIL